MIAEAHQASDAGLLAHELTTKWIELDDTIRRTNEMVQPIKKERDRVEEQLLNHLSSNGYTRPSLKLGNETINLVESKRKGGLGLDIIEQALALNGIMKEQQKSVLGTIEKLRIDKTKSYSTLVRKKPRQLRRNRTRRRAVVE
tara:strand:+ start:93 stop:521 length:429 start_codon:yes stop_codon:yes gene_type:complete